LQREEKEERNDASPAVVLTCRFHQFIASVTYCSEEQTPEQEARDRWGYEEGERMRVAQERERWLDGLEEVVEITQGWRWTLMFYTEFGTSVSSLVSAGLEQ